MAPKKNADSKPDGAHKPKPAATSNGVAHTNGNTNGNGSSDHLNGAASGHLAKPDQDAYRAEQDKIKAEIDALQLKVTAIKDKIALTSKDGPAAERRAALRAEQDGLRAAQGTNKSSRTRIHEQLDTINTNVAKRIKDLNAARQKAPFKTVSDVDNAIKDLDRKVESGSLTIAQEKRALADITSYKRARKAIEGFQAEDDAIQAEKARAAELRKELDDPEAKALSERYDAIAKELETIKKESDEAYSNRNKLFDERNAIQKELNALHERKRESVQRYRDAHDRYWQKVNEDRAKRAERYRAQRAAEEEAKRVEIIANIREEARVPAYEAQIEDCQTLVDFFGKLLHGGATAAAAIAEASLPSKPDLAGVPKLELRKVEADGNLVARKKKGEDEDNYFVGGKGKKKGGAKQPKEADKSGLLNIPLPTLTALLSLSIPPPASHGEIERTVEDLKTKKAWFEANQRQETEKNVAKAEERIRSLEAKAQAKYGDVNGANDATPSPPAEEAAATESVAESTTVEVAA